MNKVIAINLNGNAYQLEEAGYDALGAYLRTARGDLAGNPDIDEIMTDLEQAVADKCNRFLGSNKNVVTTREVERIIEEMGPVDPSVGGEDQNSGPDTSASSGPAEGRYRSEKRLYRLTEDKMVGGICAGLAAYLGLDRTIVRVAALALLFATGGGVAALYVILMWVIPEARTPEEHAEAYGVPFDARGIIDQAKSRFSEFKDSKQWRETWKAQERYWKRHAENARPGGVGSFVSFIAVFIGMFIGIRFLIGLIRIFTGPTIVRGPFSGNGPFPARLPILGTPPWVFFLTIVLGVFALQWIFRGGRGERSMASAFGVFGQVVLAILLMWMAYQMFPFVREILDTLLVVIRGNLFGMIPI